MRLLQGGYFGSRAGLTAGLSKLMLVLTIDIDA